MKVEGGNRPSASAIWATATLFVTLVSCCSLIGVSIMPLISGPSYKIFITLFTGLAVGSLVGSAVFSLIPQAFNLHMHEDSSYPWKTLVIFFGIYLFYCSERIMRLYFERRTRNKDKKRKIEELKNSNIIAAHKQSDSKLCDIEVGTSAQNNSESLISSDQRQSNNEDNVSASPTKRKLLSHGDGDNVAMTTLDQDIIKQRNSLNINNSEVATLKHTDNEDDENHEVPADLFHHHTHFSPEEIVNKMKANNSKVKREIAPVAWMIIIGDGLHNFIDGLSIGAAFSKTIYFGISTSVAVICEEFPHELGDFAVLISSGMTVRQALGFNFLSACTCYIGMVFGILLGDMTQSASYIFALAGGMFLYIALVDMMGELSATLDEPGQSPRETVKLLLMQNIGILTGIIIIFSLSWIDVR